MTDPLKPDRLLRKRNRGLQKQLDVTLQIMSEEYRQCKERMYKEERDCGKFLQSLYETVPGLKNYGHPNTRSMNASAVLRDRHYSSDASEDTDTSPATDTDGHPHPLHHSSHAQRSPSTSAAVNNRQQARWNKNRTDRESDTKASEKRRSVGDGMGSGPFRRGSQGVGGNGVRDTNRPKTADPYKPQRLLSQDDRSDRPQTGFGFRKGPSFGKNAYSDHERLVQEMVLKKFHSIFDPEVRKGTKSTTATPIAMPATFQDSRSTSDDQRSSSTDDTDDQRLDAASGDVPKTTQVNGEGENGVHHKHHCRRVVWSASPCRKAASVSAPVTDELDSPASQTPSAVDSRHSKPRSNSLTLPRGGYRIGAPHGHSALEHTPVDPKIRALALQRNLSDDDQPHSHSSEYKPHGESREYSTSKALHSPQGTIDHKAQGRTQTQTTSRPPPLNKSKSDTSVLKKHHTLGKSKMDASPHTNGPPATHVTQRRHSAINPSSPRRMSETSMNPEQLVDRLVNAGRQRPCGHPRRPKTAPNSRSELSHRLVPVSRKTIVGILSEIENQKASTRNIVTTSKELQQFVKKLAPREYLLDDDSD